MYSSEYSSSSELKASPPEGKAAKTISETNKDADLHDTLIKLNTFITRALDDLELGKELDEAKRQEGIQAMEHFFSEWRNRGFNPSVLSKIKDKPLRKDFIQKALDEMPTEDAAHNFIAKIYDLQLTELNKEELQGLVAVSQRQSEGDKEYRARVEAERCISEPSIENLYALNNILRSISHDLTKHYIWQDIQKKARDLANNILTQAFEESREKGIYIYQQIKDGPLAAPWVMATVYEGALRGSNTAEKIRFLKEDLQDISGLNAQKFLGEMNVQYGPEKTQEITQHVKATSFGTINLAFSTIEKVLTSRRVQSTWDTGRYPNGGTYRASFERAIGIRATGTEEDRHTIFGAVGFTNGHDEHFGAANSWGDCFLRLKQSTLKEKSLFLYGDLGDTHLGEWRLRQFNYDQMHIARAMVEARKQTSYVEVHVLGGVSLDDIDTVCIPKKLEEKTRAQVDELRKKYPSIHIEYV